MSARKPPSFFQRRQLNKAVRLAHKSLLAEFNYEPGDWDGAMLFFEDQADNLKLSAGGRAIPGNVITMLGGWYGQAIVETCGGRWVQDGGRCVVELPDGNTINPGDTMRDHLADDTDTSLSQVFFGLKQKLAQPQE